MPFLGKSSSGAKDAARYLTRVEDAFPVRDDSRPGHYKPSGGHVERVSFDEVQRQACSNQECTSSWTMPWRSRRRPVFEGLWGCSGRCVLALVRAALRREAGERQAGGRQMGEGAEPHRHRVPLGLVMLAQGWITNPQLQAALKLQRASGSGRIGDWLVSECGLGEEQVTRGLSVQWGCPVLSVDGFAPGEMALVMPRQFIEEFGLAPLRVVGSRLLYLGWEDRLNASVAYAVEQMSGLRVESGLVDGAKLQSARMRLLEAEGVAVTVQTAANEDALAGLIAGVLEHKQPLASRLVRLHQHYWLRLWLESGTKGTAGNLPRSREDMQDCIFSVGARA